MHDYQMLADNDRVMIAVSGGVDSLTLAWLMQHWQQKAPIRYQIHAVHIDMGIDAEATFAVEKQLQLLNLPYTIKKTGFDLQKLAERQEKNLCFHCSKKRRNLLFDFARVHDFSKVAFGHHQEDLIETLFLNMLYSGNMSTMVPRQDIFAGTLSLVRPLAYLEKRQIVELAEFLDITPVANPCPVAKDSKREQVRHLLSTLYGRDPKIKANIFSAMGNIKQQYLLQPLNKRSNPQDADNP